MLNSFFPVHDPVLIFAILMLIALAAPLISGRLKLSGIIGLIVTGIIIGPHGLCILERKGEIELFGAVGLLYIMFIAGLELDRAQFMRHRHHSLIFGVFTFIIPLILGALMVRYVLNFTWQASVLLASMFSSHTLLTYPIASRLGLSRQRSVTTTIGGTIITDTAAFIVLAIIVALHKDEATLFFWPSLFIYMIIYAVSVVVILPRLTKWFFRNIATDGVIAFTGVLAAAYLCAYMAYAARLEPIIGAFLAGLILNNFIPEKSALMNRIQFVGHSIFIPFFLISVGMLVNVRLLFSGSQALIIAAVMVFAGLVTKWLAAVSTKAVLRYSNQEGMLIYGLSVNQAAATLAAVLVGYNIGIFSEPVLTGTIIMILVTTIAGSWVTERYARMVALKEEQEPYQISKAPHRILIPLAGTHTAEELINLAVLLRPRDSHEPLYPLTVVRLGESTDERIAEAEKSLGHAVVRTLESDTPSFPTVRAALDTAIGIQQAVIDLRISLIISAWKGQASFYPHVFGRTLDAVIDNTGQMIFISRCGIPLNTMKRVILAVPPLGDHQQGFMAVVRTIKTLAHQLDASMLTVALPETIGRVSDIIQKSAPNLLESYTQIKKWGELIEWMDKVLSADDLFVLISVRKGRLAWQPNLSRMPQIISKKTDGKNFIIAYPPEFSGDEGTISQEAGVPASPLFFPAGHILLNLSGTSISDAIDRLLQPFFHSKQLHREKIANMLTCMAETEPMELSPGVILLHAHIDEVSMPTAFLGINKQGWKLPRIQEAKTMFILLSSKDAPPELHLKALADLVRPFHKSNSAGILSEFSSAEEVLKVFSINKH